jgi:hypothetical protein
MNIIHEIEAKFEAGLDQNAKAAGEAVSQETVSDALGSMNAMERRLLREHYTELGIHSPAHRAMAAMIH